MNILIVGSGGREHALAWKVAQSDRTSKLYCAPGNGGTAALAQNVDIAADDLPRLMQFAGDQDIGLTVVGPEDPLCGGIVDLFQKAGLRIFGPVAAVAKLEGDKGYAKQLMNRLAVPTAEGRVFEDYRRARDYVATREIALVVKAAGLAKGKGVVVCEDPADALLALERIMIDKCYGSAGARVVVEERLTGPEVSLQALIDGQTIYLLETAQDYKPIGEGNSGPNTGGMGAYSPAETLTDAQLDRICADIVVPVVDAMKRQGTPYRGVLYVGLMLTPAGPKVLEFNCRFGDPETQVLLPRLQTDLVDVMEAVINGRLSDMTLDWDPRPAVCVVLASAGYPGPIEAGRVITGLERADRLDNVVVFRAAAAAEGTQCVTTGGRVLGVTAMSADVDQARQLAYETVDMIHFEGCYCRRDIAR